MLERQKQDAHLFSWASFNARSHPTESMSSPNLCACEHREPHLLEWSAESVHSPHKKVSSNLQFLLPITRKNQPPHLCFISTTIKDDDSFLSQVIFDTQKTTFLSQVITHKNRPFYLKWLHTKMNLPAYASWKTTIMRWLLSTSGDSIWWQR